HVAEPIIGPAEGIDDVTGVGALLDRALDHAHAVVEIDALVDPGIAEIVEHVRLVAGELERLLEIGLALRALLSALETEATKIIDHPVRLLEFADGVARAGRCRLRAGHARGSSESSLGKSRPLSEKDRPALGGVAFSLGAGSEHVLSHLPQSSSASRFTAGAAAFFIL